MKRFLIVAVFLTSMFYVSYSHAQTSGSANYAVPSSLAPENSSSLDGTGVRMTNQGCGYGNQRAPATYEEEQVRDIQKFLKMNKRDASKFKRDAGRLERELNKTKEDLERLFNNKVDVNAFVENVERCSGVYADLKSKAGMDTEALRAEKKKLFVSSHIISEEEMSKNSTVESFESTNEHSARCALAVSRLDGKNFDPVAMCYGHALGGNVDYSKGEIASLSTSSKVTRCGSIVKRVARLQKEMERTLAAAEKAEAKQSDYEDKLSDARDALADSRRQDKELGLDQVDIDADSDGIRNCPNCIEMRRQQGGSAGFDNKAGLWYLAGVLLDSGIRGAVDVTNARRNSSLGYPTGPAPWVPSAMGLFQGISNYSMGYPFGNGGYYGGINGGMANGSWGCAPMMYGSQPYAMGPGSPYGQSGMFNPGMIPGYGFSGPGYMNGMSNPYAMGCMQAGYGCGGLGGIQGMLNGLLGPLAGLGIGSSYGLGLPGMYGGFAPGMGGPLGGFGMANGLGMPGMGGGFGLGLGGPGMFGMGGMGGMGFNPMMGGMGGMGFNPMMGGMGGFGGMGGMGGMNSQYQMQMMNQQIQQMQAYQQQMQDYMQRYSQASQTYMQGLQLLQQSQSIIGSGGMGGMGGMMGGFNMGIGVNMPIPGTNYQAGTMPPNSFGTNPGGSFR